MIICINASRARSGGARAHLIGIISNMQPVSFGIDEVHVWADLSLLDSLPNFSWLFKHFNPVADKTIIRQIAWEFFSLPRCLSSVRCDLLLNVDAGSVCRFRPSVTMSRDMLSYERGEAARYGFSSARLRLILLRYLQNSSLKRSEGVIFLSKYAKRIIESEVGGLKSTALIPHGVGSSFKDVSPLSSFPIHGERSVKLLYISNTDLYKHQWMVVQAVELLRKRKFDVTIVLIGGSTTLAEKRLQRQIKLSDPKSEFVTRLYFISHSDLSNYLSESDLFVFASSCENMPNTLIEAMAAGLPIACSERGPMPEFLRDAGVYFDPESPESISAAVESLILDPYLRLRCSSRAKSLAAHYSWDRCANDTLEFLVRTFKIVSK